MTVHLASIDHSIRAWVVAHRIGALNGVMWGLSAIGRGGMIFLVAALAIAVRRRQLSAFVQVGAVVIAAWLIADHVVKPAFGRTRPFVGTTAVDVIGGRPNDSSFPSGHATAAFAGAAALGRLVPGAALAWWALAAAIAYSRVYLGVHYPADVIGGALLGLAVAAATRIATRRWKGVLG